MRSLALAFITLLVLSVSLTASAGSVDKALPLAGLSGGSISVDGDPVEWGVFDCTGKAPGLYLETVNEIPQWIWCDPLGDERTDFSQGSPDKRVDLIQFRVTGDENYLYGLIIVNNMDFNYIGEDGGTIVAIAINRNGETIGEEWFSGDSDTKVSSDARWQYQIVVNLADSRYRGQGRTFVSDVLRENWGGIFYIVNSSWSFKTDEDSLAATNVSNNAIEFKVRWDTIGGVPSDGSFFLRVSLITGRGWSNFDNNGGGFWDIGGTSTSDALDAITNVTGNTWEEVSDGDVDYYIDLYFATTPPHYPIPEPGLMVVTVTAVSAFAMVFLLRRRK
ncbi:hypothetical protein IMZ38_00745 [Thermosphaera chiliense]|uniref:Uncharacterized protein n=1 Tax=Thermosphaera chiliense TaxID=3402707 RepID=A0A7M1USQ9_9CREN|nr:hypothetical protein [Thermosphaera aggregans]QOR94513.1 hypothetical protein IMZ38_00745 [Thermosphaera aggregans]